MRTNDVYPSRLHLINSHTHNVYVTQAPNALLCCVRTALMWVVVGVGVITHEQPLMGFHMQLGPDVRGNLEFRGISALLSNAWT